MRVLQRRAGAGSCLETSVAQRRARDTRASTPMGLILILALAGALSMAPDAAAQGRGPFTLGSSVLTTASANGTTARTQTVGASGKSSRRVLRASRSHRREGGGHRRRVAVHLLLVRRGVLSAQGVVTPARGFRRALVQMRHGHRWKAVHRGVPIRKRGKFSVRWKVERRTSKVAVRAIALGRGGKRLVGRVTTLRIGAHGSAAYTVPATTRIYAGNEVSSAKAGPSGETLVELVPGSAKPVVGGHVALGPSSTLPFGMFGSVVRVSSSGRGWTVGLRRAAIDQVLDNVSLHFDEDVTPQVVDSLGRPVGSRSRSGAIRISGPASFAHASSLGSVFSCKSSGRSTSADSAFDSTRPMPLNIELSHLHALDVFDEGSFFPHRDPFFLMQVHGEAQASIGFQAKSSFSCELSDSFRESHRLAFPLGAIGPVPVTMYLEPTLKFEVSGSGTVSLSQHHYWAITLEQNGFSPFKAHLAHSADPVDFHATAAIGASLFAGGDLSVMFGAGEGSWAVQAGIYGAFGPDFELATSTDQPGCLTATAKLEADLGVRLQVLMKRWSAQLASLTTRPVNLGGPWCVGGGSGSGPVGGGSGGSDGGGSGGGETTPPPGGGEQPLATLSPAWTGYLYDGDLPGTGGNTETGPEATSVDAPPGTQVINTGGTGDATLVGLPHTLGTFDFHASWLGPTEPGRGSFRLTVGPPNATLPPTALLHLGIVNDVYGAYIDALRPSPDGRLIAAVIGGSDILAIYDPTSQTLLPLTTGAEPSGIGYGGWQANLGWSPDGRYLAFTSAEPLLGPTANGPWYNVYLYDTVTHTLSRLTDGTNGYSFNPSWSPDGTLLTFNQDEKVAVYDLATGNTEILPCPSPFPGCRAVTSSDNFSSEPWGANSQYLTFLEMTDNYYTPTAVLVWDRATDSVRKLADGFSARLSPDGARAMVNSGEDGELKLLNVASGEVERTYPHTGISLESQQMTGPSVWSPNGDYVTGWRAASPFHGPAVMSVTTGEITNISPEGGALAGWRGNSPMWCYYHVNPENSVEGLDCATYNEESDSASVTHLDSPEVFGLDSSGYYGEIGSEDSADYAVATWVPWPH